jgi:hypothetical protein
VVTKFSTYSRKLRQEHFPIRRILKCTALLNRIYFKQGKVGLYLSNTKNVKSDNSPLVTGTHFLVNSSWVSWNITPIVRQFKWHWMNPWWWLKNQVLKSAETKTSLLLSPQYTTFNISKYISHFEILMILCSASGLGLSCLNLNFENVVMYEKINMSVWQLEDIFSMAHTNFHKWLRMLCLRASNHLWIDISQVRTRQNKFIYTVFQHCGYHIVLICLVEFYIILPSTFILPSSTHIYRFDLKSDKQTLITT